MLYLLSQYSSIWEHLNLPFLLFIIFGGLSTHIYLAAWVYEDLKRRYAVQLKWPIFIVIAGIIGVLIYIAVRKEFGNNIDIYDGKVIRGKSNKREEFNTGEQGIYNFILKGPSRVEWNCYTDSEKSLRVRRNDEVKVIGTKIKDRIKVRILALFNFTQNEFINFNKEQSKKRAFRLRILLVFLGLVIVLALIGSLIAVLEDSQGYIKFLYYGVYVVGFYFITFLIIAIIDKKDTEKLRKYYKRKDELLDTEYSSLVSKLRINKKEITDLDDLVDHLRVIYEKNHCWAVHNNFDVYLNQHNNYYHKPYSMALS